MSRFINIVVLVAGVIIAGIGIAVVRHGPEYVVVPGMGVGLIVLAVVRDNRREKRKKDQQQVESNRRVAELTKAPWLPGQILAIRGSVALAIMLLVFGTIAALMVYTELAKVSGTQWNIVTIGLIAFPMLVISMTRQFAGVFKPACVLDRNGIATPIYGRIPWRDITGINLGQRSYRGHITYTLSFRVERYRQVVHDSHWTERIMTLFGLGASRRGVVSVLLNDPVEQPQTIYAVARFLWKQATNSSYEWSPAMPDEVNAAARRLGERLGKIAAPNEFDRMAERPKEMLAEAERIKSDLSILSNGLRRVGSRVSWIIGIGVVLLLFRIAEYWLNRH